MYAGLAGFQCPAHSKKVLELECSNRSPGSVALPGPERTHGYASSSGNSGTQLVASASVSAFLFQAKGLSSHIFTASPFKERSAGSAARTHSNSPADSKNPKEENYRSILATSASTVFGLAFPPIHPSGVYPYYCQATIMKIPPLFPPNAW